MELTRLLSDPSNPAAKLISGWDGKPPVSDRAFQTRSFRPKQLQNRLELDEVAELVATYQAGGTIKELAEKFQVNRTTVIRQLDRAGVPTRYRRLNPSQIEEVAQLYSEGWSLSQLGKYLGVSAGTVLNAFRKWTRFGRSRSIPTIRAGRHSVIAGPPTKRQTAIVRRGGNGI